jgi:hypothetical protein
MEPSSGNRRRGRPNAFSEAELKDAGGRASLSPRHLQNRAYALRARRRLAGLRWWEEVCGDPDVPQCVLCELGRIEDDARFRDAVWWHWYSGRDLSAKQAAEALKRMRTGKTPEEGPVTLYRRLMRTVGDFRMSYPGASVRYQEDQVELVLRTIRLARR